MRAWRAELRPSSSGSVRSTTKPSQAEIAAAEAAAAQAIRAYQAAQTAQPVAPAEPLAAAQRAEAETEETEAEAGGEETAVATSGGTPGGKAWLCFIFKDRGGGVAKGIIWGDPRQAWLNVRYCRFFLPFCFPLYFSCLSEDLGAPSNAVGDTVGELPEPRGASKAALRGEVELPLHEPRRLCSPKGDSNTEGGFYANLASSNLSTSRSFFSLSFGILGK